MVRRKKVAAVATRNTISSTTTITNVFLKKNSQGDEARGVTELALCGLIRSCSAASSAGWGVEAKFARSLSYIKCTFIAYYTSSNLLHMLPCFPLSLSLSISNLIKRFNLIYSILTQGTRIMKITCQGHWSGSEHRPSAKTRKQISVRLSSNSPSSLRNCRPYSELWLVVIILPSHI